MGRIANCQYVVNAINQRLGFNRLAVEAGTAQHIANMRYLLQSIDRANGGMTALGMMDDFATQRIADVEAVDFCVANHLIRTPPGSRTFTPGSHPFEVPLGVIQLTVTLVGGGGGGGSGIRQNSIGGGTGGGGGGILVAVVDVWPGDRIDLVVGSGGSINGGQGGDTSFTYTPSNNRSRIFLRAHGGGGGNNFPSLIGGSGGIYTVEGIQPSFVITNQRGGNGGNVSLNVPEIIRQAQHGEHVRGGFGGNPGGFFSDNPNAPSGSGGGGSGGGGSFSDGGNGGDSGPRLDGFPALPLPPGNRGGGGGGNFPDNVFPAVRDIDGAAGAHGYIYIRWF